jgi:DNA-binding CsgD family transcriptional regulator
LDALAPTRNFYEVRSDECALGGDAAELAFAALQGLAQGVAVLDPLGRVEYANPAARVTLLRAGWRFVKDHLIAPGDHARRALASALDRVLRHGCMQLVSLGEDAAPVAALSPVEIGSSRRALLAIGRETVCGAIELQLFAAKHDLTLAESRVLSQLARGLRPHEIARLHGVHLATVRTQVATLRAKTRSNSVVELLDRVARLPGFVPKMACASAAA